MMRKKDIKVINDILFDALFTKNCGKLFSPQKIKTL